MQSSKKNTTACCQDKSRPEARTFRLRVRKSWRLLAATYNPFNESVWLLDHTGVLTAITPPNKQARICLARRLDNKVHFCPAVSALAHRRLHALWVQPSRGR